MVNPIIAMNNIDVCIPVFSLLNRCSLCLNPPAIRLNPRIKRIFPKIDPVIDALTNVKRPAFIAEVAIINSGALPNVTLSNEPAVAP